MSKSVVLVSGGLDSTTLLHWVVDRYGADDIYALIMFYGQKHSKEIDCAKFQCETVGVPWSEIDLSVLSSFFGKASSLLASSEIAIPHVSEVMGDPQPSTYVPNRNMIFLSIAVGFAESIGSGRVYYGAQRHDLYGYWDTQPDFLARMNHVLGLNRKATPYIEAPFIHMKKADIINTGRHLKVDYSQTWSCYQGDKLACGVCGTCAERIQGFKELGLTDPIQYVKEIK